MTKKENATIRCPKCSHVLADIQVDGTLVEQVRPREYPRDRDAPVLLTASEAARLLGISRSSLYQLRYGGHIWAVSVGRSVPIPRSEVERIAREGVA